MATSPNFGWLEPDNTDLVKNGALAIRTAVNAIDTSMGDLLGGTTGQVLSKNSNTSMDFTWVTTDDTNAIQNAIVDAKGDLIAASAADTPARLAVGTDNYFLKADSTAATGLAWSGAYTTFTPSFTNLTVGNGTNNGKYLQIGKFVHVVTQLIWGSTTSITGAPVRHNFPIAANNGQAQIIGEAYILDAGTQDYPAGLIKAGTDNCVLSVLDASGTYGKFASMSSTIPFTWTTNDQINLSYVYEVA